MNSSLACLPKHLPSLSSGMFLFKPRATRMGEGTMAVVLSRSKRPMSNISNISKPVAPTPSTADASSSGATMTKEASPRQRNPTLRPNLFAPGNLPPKLDQSTFQLEFSTSSNGSEGAFDIPVIPEPEAKYGQLSCTLTLSGYMPDHLDLAAYFCKYSAHAMGLPCPAVMAPPSKVERFHTMKGPFVHTKKQELFERVTHIRQMQLFDASPESVSAWMSYVLESIPPGIAVSVDRVNSWEAIPEGVVDDVAKKNEISDQSSIVSFQDQVLRKREEYLAQFLSSASSSARPSDKKSS